MAKVRKVGYDPNKVESGGNFVHHPAPALVRVKCTEADLDFTSSTGNDGVHLQFKIVGSKPPKKGQEWSTLHHYLTFTDAAQWREVEMMEALLGKRVKSYKDTDLVGKLCLAKLRPEDYEGETQAKIARLLALDEDEDDDDDLDEDDDSEPDDDADDEDDADADDDDSDDEDDDDEADDDYNEWSLPQLRAELEDRGLESKGRKNTLVARLEEHDASDDEGEEEDDDEGDDEEAPDYSEWSLRDLRAEAKERGINTRGLDKDGLAEALEEDDGDPFGDDEDE
jgi:hypothetical protein